MISKTGHPITYSANLINYYIGKYVLGVKCLKSMNLKKNTKDYFCIN